MPNSGCRMLLRARHELDAHIQVLDRAAVGAEPLDDAVAQGRNGVEHRLQPGAGVARCGSHRHRECGERKDPPAAANRLHLARRAFDDRVDDLERLPGAGLHQLPDRPVERAANLRLEFAGACA